MQTSFRFFASIILMFSLSVGSLAADRVTSSESAGYRIYPADVPNLGILYVDHQATGRSGHGGQAITECVNGDIIAFYSNVSGTVRRGHAVAGWAEYRISEDGGATWSEPYVLEHSKAAWEDPESGPILVEEAMTAPNGTVVAIGRRFTDPKGYKWGSRKPVYFLSYDHGRTWSEPREFDPGAEKWMLARDEGSMLHDGKLFVLFHDRFVPKPHVPKYRLYVSEDNGESFQKRSVLPLSEKQWYGTIGSLPNGDIIVYSYNNDDDGTVLQYVTSSDDGGTWSEVKTTPFAKRLRNPQLSQRVGGLYFMHGRSGSFGPDPRHLVLYSSTDGINWDDGVYLNKGNTDDLDSYSTNEVIGKYDLYTPERLLIQSSIAYDEAGRRVNLHHWFVDLLD